MTEPLNSLLVEIADRDPMRHAFPLRLTLADGSAASDWLNLADLPPPPAPRARGTDLAAYGLLLFERLFPGPLLALFRQAWITAQRGRGVLHLQLWIKSNAPELQAIPWEMLYVQEATGAPVPLAANPLVAFSRYVDSPNPFVAPLERWPLRVLIAIGAPNDLGTRWGGLTPVDFALERSRLAAVLDAVSSAGQIEYRFIHPATPEALLRAMEDGYQMVIFYGHGLYAPRLGTSLMLQRDDGAGQLLIGSDLVAALRRNGTRPALFVLISCNTAPQRADPALDNLGIQIVRDGGVPAVVAMRDLVEIDLARAFTQYLCDYLLRYGMIDRAVAAARRQVFDPQSANWSTPVLYMRSRDGRLFVPNAQLEFARLLSNDPQISPAASAAPAGARLNLLRSAPDEQPNPREASVWLDELLALGQNQTTPAPLVVSGGSRISRSLLLQQWAWKQNRHAATQMVAVYLALADDRHLQAGMRIEDRLIEAASLLDPAHGVALMNLLAEGKDGGAARFVLLIDGLESLDPARRVLVTELLTTLARRWPAQRIVISVEEVAAPELLRQPDTFWLLLTPLSERQIRAYLRYRDPPRALSHLRAIMRGGLRDLASDPQMLTAIAERLIEDTRSRTLTRDEVLSGLLDRLVERAASAGVTRAAARTGIIALAWTLHSSLRSSMQMQDARNLLRSIEPEADLYTALGQAGALVEIGGALVQMPHLALQSYAAALALQERADLATQLTEIMVQAGLPQRMDWWSQVLIGLAQRSERLDLLAPIWAAATQELSGAQALVAARCVGAFFQARRQSASLLVRRPSADEERHLNSLIDRLLIQLDPRFEPSAALRAMLAEALGQLAYPQVRSALRRQLGERVLLVDDTWQYDRPLVRAAAARALRDMPGSSEESGQFNTLLQAWRRNQHEALVTALTAPDYQSDERALAAFALSDMSDQAGVQERLLDLLLHGEGEGAKKEWQATQAAIADALILEADERLADLLEPALLAQADLDLRTEILMLNIVGACAGHRPALHDWLAQRSQKPRIPLVASLAQMALARALSSSASQDDALRSQLEASARHVIETPISAEVPMVASQRRLAIQTLVWLGVTGDGTPPPAITSWPVALRQAWWELVGG
nr:CHAT domain-containing protein [Oscillochloris trichoides]